MQITVTANQISEMPDKTMQGNLFKAETFQCSWMDLPTKYIPAKSLATNLTKICKVIFATAIGYT